MSMFLPGGGNPFGGLGGFRIPSISMRVSVNAFFDRKAVKDALSAAEYQGLTRSSLRVKDYAKRSIRKMGLARPALRIMTQNPGVPLRQLANRPGTSQRTRNTIATRLREIQTRPPSAPGTPPHTHVPYGHMLGFRRNLWNFYDAMSHSAVVGPSKKGRMLPYLHEFGGTQTLRQWVYRPRYDGSYTPIVWNMPTGQRPQNRGRWDVTGNVRRVTYPERPFMYPALLRAIARGDLAKAFGGTFRAGQAGRGVVIRAG